MKYLVFRLETRSGADYQVSAHRDAHQTRAVEVGELEAPSHQIAVKLLQHVLREALMREDRFFPGPSFSHLLPLTR